MRQAVMTRKKKTDNYIFYLILLFPLIFMLFNILFKGDGIRVFYFLYSSVVFILYLWKRNGIRIKKSDGLFLSIVVIKLAYDFLAYPSSMGDSISIAFLFLYLKLYSDEKNVTGYSSFLTNKSKKVFGVYCIYLMGILYTVIFGNGLVNQWGTISLYGHYSLAHFLAYELLVLFANCYYLYTKERKKKWIILLTIFFALMILTTVRTVVLSMLVAICYVFIKQKGFRKYAFGIMALVALFVAFRYTNLFSFIIEKTQNAQKLGSATSARGLMWSSSYNYFLHNSFFQKIMGTGIEPLMQWNYVYTRMLVQAHNDFLSVLAAFGLFSLILYLVSLYFFCRGKDGLGLFLVVLVLIMFNGLYSYASGVIGLISLKIVFRSINDRVRSRTEKQEIGMA